MLHPKDAWPLLKEAGNGWSESNIPRLGAALAFYSVLSISPLLLILIAIAGSVFGQEAASGQIVAEIQGLIGRDAAKMIETILTQAQQPSEGIIATVIGVATLLLGASGVFGELQGALNTIWKVKRVPGGGIVTLVKARFLSFSMVLGTGFLLMVSLVISAALAAIGGFFVGLLPDLAPLLEVLNFIVTLALFTTLFAMIFKVLPDRHISWKDVWAGAFITAILFSLGKFGIGLYLGRSTVASAYGAAGSLVILLIWIYYSAQILLFGAVLTEAYSRWRAAKVPHTP